MFIETGFYKLVIVPFGYILFSTKKPKGLVRCYLKTPIHFTSMAINDYYRGIYSVI